MYGRTRRGDAPHPASRRLVGGTHRRRPGTERRHRHTALDYRSSAGQCGASLLSLVLRDHDGRVGGVRRRGSLARGVTAPAFSCVQHYKGDQLNEEGRLREWVGGSADERASQKGKEQEYPTVGTRANIP